MNRVVNMLLWKYTNISAFVSDDDNEALEYFASMPWKMLDNISWYRDAKARLKYQFNVEGIPTLLLFDGEGTTQGYGIEICGLKKLKRKDDSMRKSKNWRWTFSIRLWHFSILIRKGMLFLVYFSARWCYANESFTEKNIAHSFPTEMLLRSSLFPVILMRLKLQAILQKCYPETHLGWWQGEIIK